jgi:hypothetical protein
MARSALGLILADDMLIELRVSTVIMGAGRPTMRRWLKLHPAARRMRHVLRLRKDDKSADGLLLDDQVMAGIDTETAPI